MGSIQLTRPLTTRTVPCTVSAAAIGDSDESSSPCQLIDSTAKTTETISVLLNKENGKLKGSALLANCASAVFCVGSSNVNLPHRLELASEGRYGRADISFSPRSDGNITALVTADLEQLTAAIRELSRRQFCCVDGGSQPRSVKCFSPELKCKPPHCMCMVNAYIP